jgi:hypothetical protein
MSITPGKGSGVDAALTRGLGLCSKRELKECHAWMLLNKEPVKVFSLEIFSLLGIFSLDTFPKRAILPPLRTALLEVARIPWAPEV